MQNQQPQIPNKFYELYGKKSLTADVQAENIAALKAENEAIWIDSNVNDLEFAKTALKYIGKILRYAIGYMNTY